MSQGKITVYPQNWTRVLCDVTETQNMWIGQEGHIPKREEEPMMKEIEKRDPKTDDLDSDDGASIFLGESAFSPAITVLYSGLPKPTTTPSVYLDKGPDADTLISNTVAVGNPRNMTRAKDSTKRGCTPDTLTMNRPCKNAQTLHGSCKNAQILYGPCKNARSMHGSDPQCSTKSMDSSDVREDDDEKDLDPSIAVHLPPGDKMEDDSTAEDVNMQNEDILPVLDAGCNIPPIRDSGHITPVKNHGLETLTMNQPCRNAQTMYGPCKNAQTIQGPCKNAHFMHGSDPECSTKSMDSSDVLEEVSSADKKNISELEAEDRKQMSGLVDLSWLTSDTIEEEIKPTLNDPWYNSSATESKENNERRTRINAELEEAAKKKLEDDAIFKVPVIPPYMSLTEVQNKKVGLTSNTVVLLEDDEVQQKSSWSNIGLLHSEDIKKKKVPTATLR